MSASKGITAQVVKSTIGQHSKKNISLIPLGGSNNCSRSNNPSAQRFIRLKGKMIARVMPPSSSPYTRNNNNNNNNNSETSRRRRLTKSFFRHFSTTTIGGDTTTTAAAAAAAAAAATTTTTNPTIHIYNALDQNTLNYSKSWAWQHVLLSHRLDIRRRHRHHRHITDGSGDDGNTDDDNDCLLFLEHSPVYTLGRGSDERNIKFLNNNSNNKNHDEILYQLSRKARGPGTARLAVDNKRQQDSIISNSNSSRRSIGDVIQTLSEIATPVIAPNGVPIYRVERGGEVTFHGPRQLVVYPMLDLQRGEPYRQDLHWYLRMIEEVVIQTLAYYNIQGKRDEENTGVWVNDEKVAAVGISSSRWITTHGFAINVDPNLDYFDTSVILPCGIDGKGVTSIGKILQERREKDKEKSGKYTTTAISTTNNNTITPPPTPPTLMEVSQVVLESMESVFGITNFVSKVPPNLR